MPAATAAVDEFTSKVIKALENPEYDWRTLAGVAGEVGSSEVDVVAVLNSLKDIVVRAQDSEGHPIFTTRRHYEETHGFGDKLISALSDRVVA
jgi:hypothetical protein